jgi:hypothetical protein
MDNHVLRTRQRGSSQCYSRWHSRRGNWQSDMGRHFRHAYDSLTEPTRSAIAVNMQMVHDCLAVFEDDNTFWNIEMQGQEWKNKEHQVPKSSVLCCIVPLDPGPRVQHEAYSCLHGLNGIFLDVIPIDRPSCIYGTPQFTYLWIY